MEKELRREKQAARSPAGSVRMLPVAIEPFRPGTRSHYTLRVSARADIRWMEVKEDGTRRETTRPITSADAFDLHVFPRERPRPATARTAIFDPLGRTANVVGQMGLNPVKPKRREREEPQDDFVPTSLYRAVADRWGCNPDRFRQW